MVKWLFAAVMLAGLSGAASAATIDFTEGDAISGTILGDVRWDVTNKPKTLSATTHWNKAGCEGYGWTFDCKSAVVDGKNRYDVGFGIKGGKNGTEIDTAEFVEVIFSKRVNVTGFAGMLTYANGSAGKLDGNREQVVLQYLKGNGRWGSLTADPKDDVGKSFDTVGLAFLLNQSMYTTAVRFRAGGVGTWDDGSFDVTAAGLQVAAVPVPAGLPLLLTGLGALVLGARRKKRLAA